MGQDYSEHHREYNFQKKVKHIIDNVEWETLRLIDYRNSTFDNQVYLVMGFEDEYTHEFPVNVSVFKIPNFELFVMRINDLYKRYLKENKEVKKRLKDAAKLR